MCKLVEIPLYFSATMNDVITKLSMPLIYYITEKYARRPMDTHSKLLARYENAPLIQKAGNVELRWFFCCKLLNKQLGCWWFDAEYLSVSYWHKMCRWMRYVVFIRETLQWRHYGRDGVSNQHHHHCLLNRLFRRGSKKTSKLRVTGLCRGNSPVTGEFPAQMASKAENVSICGRQHEI